MSTLDMFYCISRVLLSSVRNGVWILISWKKLCSGSSHQNIAYPYLSVCPSVSLFGIFVENLSNTYTQTRIKGERRRQGRQPMCSGTYLSNFFCDFTSFVWFPLELLVNNFWCGVWSSKYCRIVVIYRSILISIYFWHTLTPWKVVLAFLYRSFYCQY